MRALGACLLMLALYAGAGSEGSPMVSLASLGVLGLILWICRRAR